MESTIEDSNVSGNQRNPSAVTTGSAPEMPTSNPSDPLGIPMIDDTNIDESDDGVVHISSVFSLAPDDQPTKALPNTIVRPDVTSQQPAAKSADRPVVSRLSAARCGSEELGPLNVTRTYVMKPDSGSVRFIPTYNVDRDPKQRGNYSNGKYILPKTSEAASSPTKPAVVTTSGSSLVTTNSSPITGNPSIVGKNITVSSNAAAMSSNSSSQSTAPRSSAVATRDATTVTRTNLIGSKSFATTSALNQSPVVSSVPSISLRAEPLPGGNVVRLQPVANVQNASGQTMQIPLTNYPTRPSPILARPPEQRAGAVSTVQLTNNVNSHVSTAARALTTTIAANTAQVRANAPVVINPTAAQQILAIQQGVAKGPKLVMVTKQGSNPQQGQLMYLVDSTNSTDGKTFRFIIPDVKTSPQNRPVLVSTASPTLVQVPSMVAKPAAGTQTPKQPSDSTAHVKTPQQTLYFKQDSTETTPEAASASPLQRTESPSDTSSTSSADPGSSPHEVRIRQLKELLKKQEEAVEQIREKRRKELEGIRESSKSAANSDCSRKSESSSPFLVPLPPKRAKLDVSKAKQTGQAQGFLPTGEDANFVKLVGLEKVVQKIKDAKQGT